MSRPAKHIARDEHKFFCGRTNHHGVCWPTWESYRETPSDRRDYVCGSCVDRGFQAERRARREAQR